MAMFKKGNEPKAAKAPKAEKASKKAPAPGDYKPFWVAWQEKRASGKTPRRESSIPKEKMPKEDVIKLMGCTALLVATIIVFIIGSKVANQRAKTPAEIAREAAAKAKDSTPQGQEE